MPDYGQQERDGKGEIKVRTRTGYAYYKPDNRPNHASDDKDPAELADVHG